MVTTAEKLRELRRIESIHAAVDTTRHTGSGVPYKVPVQREAPSDKNPSNLKWLNIASKANTEGISK